MHRFFDLVRRNLPTDVNIWLQLRGALHKKCFRYMSIFLGKLFREYFQNFSGTLAHGRTNAMFNYFFALFAPKYLI